MDLHPGSNKSVLTADGSQRCGGQVDPTLIQIQVLHRHILDLRWVFSTSETLKPCGATTEPPAWHHLQTLQSPRCILTFDFRPAKKPSGYKSDVF